MSAAESVAVIVVTVSLLLREGQTTVHRSSARAQEEPDRWSPTNVGHHPTGGDELSCVGPSENRIGNGLRGTRPGPPRFKPPVGDR